MKNINVKIAFPVLIALLFFSFSVYATLAVPANPALRELAQPDGTKLSARIVGDEKGYSVETPDGYSIIKDGAGWWKYAIPEAGGNLAPSQLSAGRDGPRPLNLKKHIAVKPQKSPESEVFIRSDSGAKLSAPQKGSPYPGPALAPASPKLVGGPPPGGPPADEKKVLVILIKFPDKPEAADSTPDYYDDLVFSPEDGANSMNNYYREVSYNKTNITGSIAGSKWYEAAHDLGWYGSDNGFIDFNESADVIDDMYISKLAKEAIQLADPDVNYSEYDSDGDGTIDHILVVHAGDGQEASDEDADIWSHQWIILNNCKEDWGCEIGIDTDDGVKAMTYTMVAETSPLGTFAHEFGHDLGLPDLYNYNGGPGSVGDWDIMATGGWLDDGNTPAHFSAWSKLMMGWVSPTVVDSGMNGNSQSIGQAEYNSNDIFAFFIDGFFTNEYFLVENRQQTSYDSFLPGSGLLIWRIDETRQSNSMPVRRKVSLMEADDNDNPTESTDPWYDNTDGFSDSSEPDSNSYSGDTTGVSVTDIGSSGETISAILNVGTTAPNVPFIQGLPEYSNGTVTVSWLDFLEPVFSSFAENDTGSWNFSGGFNVSSYPRWFSPPSSFSAKGEELEASMTLVDPVDLSGVWNPILTFRTDSILSSIVDFAYVKVSTDGEDWKTLDVFSGYDFETRRTYSFDRYANQSIYLRFEVTTDENSFFSYFSLDDIYILNSSKPADFRNFELYRHDSPIDTDNIEDAEKIPVPAYTVQATSVEDDPPFEGTWYYSVAAVDILGNSMLSENVQTTFDVTPPDMVSSTPEDGSVTQNTSPEISAMFSDTVSGIDTDSIAMEVNGETVEASVETGKGTVTVSYTPEFLEKGYHIVSVTVSDNAGNSATHVWEFAIGTPPQYTSISQDPSGDPLYGTDVRVESSWTDDTAITAVLLSNYTGEWEKHSPLTEDNQTFYYVIPRAALKGGQTVSWAYGAFDEVGVVNGSMPEQSFTVQKAPTSVEMLLDGNGTGGVYDKGSMINVTTIVNATGRIASLKTNFSDWDGPLACAVPAGGGGGGGAGGGAGGGGASPPVGGAGGGGAAAWNASTCLLGTYMDLGNYNITAYFDGDENYTGSAVSRDVTIVDISKPSINSFDITPSTAKPNSDVSVTVSAADNDAVKDVTVSCQEANNTVLFSGGLKMLESGEWFATINISNTREGPCNIKVTAADNSGNSQTNHYVGYFEINNATGASNPYANNSLSIGGSGALIDIEQDVKAALEIFTGKDVTGSFVVAAYTENPKSNNSAPPLGKYLEITAGPEINKLLSWVMIKIYYNDSDIPAGYKEENLRIYYLKKSPGVSWQVFDGPLVGGVNTTGNYVWANSTHFSLYGVFVNPVCTDGIQNQGESGVDCGGPCGSCGGDSPPGGGGGGPTGVITTITTENVTTPVPSVAFPPSETTVIPAPAPAAPAAPTAPAGPTGFAIANPQVGNIITAVLLGGAAILIVLHIKGKLPFKLGRAARQGYRYKAAKR